MRFIQSEEDLASALAEDRALIFFLADWSSYAVQGHRMFEKLETLCGSDLKASFWLADVSSVEAPPATVIVDWLKAQKVKDVNVFLAASCGNGPVIWLKRGVIVNAVYAATHHALSELRNRTESAFCETGPRCEGQLTMNTKTQIVRKTAWPYTVLHLSILVAAILLGWTIFSPDDFLRGGAYGAAAYLLFSFGSRALLLKNHKRGVTLVQLKQYEEAIREFELSYQFLDKYRWLDQYRFITMLDSSALSYREMALCNIGYSYIQLSEPERALRYYKKALEEFRESKMAKSGIEQLQTTV